MRETCFRELYFLCFIVWCFSGFYSDVECYALIDCGEDGDITQGSAVQSSLCGLVWKDQNKEQIQNVFKRFLFHYSKAQNSVGSVERESHSVHPLMRLSPKFTLRRKKQQVLSLNQNLVKVNENITEPPLSPDTEDDLWSLGRSRSRLDWMLTGKMTPSEHHKRVCK